MKKLIINANIDDLDRILDFVNTELDSHGFSQTVIPDVDLAVEEIFINISNYAYETACGEVTLFVSVADNEVVFRFEDAGKPFNPLDVPAPDLDVPLMERDIGGLGILFVKQIMDDITYSYSCGKNILTMKKRGG